MTSRRERHESDPLSRVPDVQRVDSRGCTRNLALVCAMLVFLVAAIYAQVGNHEFVSYDDVPYVTNNSHVKDGLTVKNMVWAFTDVYEANWHPITWISHMADVQLYDMHPRGHHLTNVAIHTVSTLLLLLLLLRLTGALWQSSFVAALFALHPLHVESVAWVAERKDVLSAFFCFLTLLLYSAFVADRKPTRYVLALFSFALGLMSKPMLVTLPVILLLLDYWPLDRCRLGEGPGRPGDRGTPPTTLLKEKIPFFACSLISGIATIHAQRQAMSDLNLMPLVERWENALIAYAKYLIKAVWPTDLAVLYPLPLSFPLWQAVGSLLLLLLISAAVIWRGRRYPYLPVGWFWFLITLLPVIGLVQVGSQSMADRYTYIPLIGLFIMTAWGIPELTKRLPYRSVILAVAAGAAIVVCAALTWQQLGYWRDSISLYRHTLEVTTNNAYIHYNLGQALAEKGYIDAAVRELEESLRINPSDAEAYIILGNVLNKKDDVDGAMLRYRQAVSVSPNNSKAHSNLGIALAKKGNLDVALKEFQEALRLNPQNEKAQKGLNLALTLMKQQKEAGK
jgi:protein O-mannosyl-transferase